MLANNISKLLLSIPLKNLTRLEPFIYYLLANPRGKNADNDETPLITATKFCDVDTLGALLDVSLPVTGRIVLSSEQQRLVGQTNKDGDSTLLVAVEVGKIYNVKFLLQCGANMWHIGSAKKMAIQIAFEKEFWSCVLLLLEYGSPFPSGFKVSLIPKKEKRLLKLVSLRQKYTALIQDGEIEEIRQALDEEIITPIFRSLKNQSAVSIAFFKKQYVMYALLKSMGFKEFGEEKPLEIDLLSMEDQKSMKSAMLWLVSKRCVYQSQFSRRY